VFDAPTVHRDRRGGASVEIDPRLIAPVANRRRSPCRLDFLDGIGARRSELEQAAQRETTDWSLMSARILVRA
jgi:hypothetical protein